MTTICMICDETLPNDDEYIQHMQNKHGTNSPDQAMREEKFKKNNLPPEIPNNLPPGINPSDMPDPEFLKTIQEMEKAEKQKMIAPKTPVSSPPTQPQHSPNPTTMPLELKYKWEGYHSCGNTVKTIMIKANGLLFANAYCLICNDTAEQVEVHPISEDKKLTAEEKKEKKT